MWFIIIAIIILMVYLYFRPSKEERKFRKNMKRFESLSNQELVEIIESENTNEFETGAAAYILNSRRGETTALPKEWFD